MARRPKATRRSAAAEPAIDLDGRTLDARPDTLDFRDRMYEPTLIEVPPVFPLERHLALEVPVLDQKKEGACTGFGLATVAHVLLRQRKVAPDDVDVSPRMLYEMARRYDEWPGEDYSGSSARGAMKGWHRYGICSRDLWPDGARGSGEPLDDARAENARGRPLGAYFRVNHKDIVALHSALAEVGVLYATALVHAGWQEVGADGEIAFSEDQRGGHAFAIVAYDRTGLWIQNSWGPDWGRGGFGRLSYDDWLVSGSDLWVARLAAPVQLKRETSVALSSSPAGAEAESYAYADLRPHIVTLGNDGRLSDSGTYGTSAAEVEAIVEEDLPRRTRDWTRRRVLLYAHGGLVGEKGAVQRLADYRLALLSSEVYPISFIWRSDLWTTVGNILDDAGRRRRPEGLLDATKDFMLDRLDGLVEPLARQLGGKALWDEMKENALRACDAPRGRNDPGGGTRFTLDLLAGLAGQRPPLELHVVGHSAGAIFHGPLVQLLTTEGAITSGPLRGRQGFGLTIASLALWAPACTIDFFKRYYLPAIRAGRVERFALFTLADEVEQDDDCKRIYNKSLLYLVSNAFEAEPRIPPRKEGTPLLGMERFVDKDDELTDLVSGKRAAWIRSPNQLKVGGPGASRATTHGGFDDDRATVLATLARIIGRQVPAVDVEFQRSAPSRRARRRDFDRETGAAVGVS